ncbi:hypothetical protein C8Q73DRAFT_686621 [Cubamyces lactineus]|nr:hypothetical protein C8Q73DRAFT_686621 [Cubamyces lactineus]
MTTTLISQMLPLDVVRAQSTQQTVGVCVVLWMEERHSATSTTGAMSIVTVLLDSVYSLALSVIRRMLDIDWHDIPRLGGVCRQGIIWPIPHHSTYSSPSRVISKQAQPSQASSRL